MSEASRSERESQTSLEEMKESLGLYSDASLEEVSSELAEYSGGRLPSLESKDGDEKKIKFSESVLEMLGIDPASSAKYSKIISALKERFSKE